MTTEVQDRSGTVVGAALVAVGTLTLVGRFFDFDAGDLLWPFFIILPGLLFS